MTYDRQFTQSSKQQTSSETLLGRVPPANYDAERAVLGAILLHEEGLNRTSDFLHADDFYTIAHKTIYDAMLVLAKRSCRIDLISLQDELIKKQQLETIGGTAYLMSLQEDIPVVGLIEQHARIIKEKAMLRELIGSATGIIENCYTQNDSNIDGVLDHAEKTIFSISHKRTSTAFVQLDIWLKRTFNHLSTIKSHGKGITGISSGYHKLDIMTSGFQKSDLIVLAARPSMGKTALALSIAAHACFQGSAVGIFSLEMAAEQLTLRLLSSESRIAHHKIRNADITSDEWIELTNVATRLADRKMFIDDTALITIMDLRAKARKLKSENKLDLLVIDYLQLISSSSRHENRHQEVSEISRALKGLAKELNIPIIALSQLSRAVDSRMDKRPMLSDLRDSGAIEQDADLIMFLYRDAVYNPESENPTAAELIVGKQRNGPTGTVFLNFARELTKFEESDEHNFGG